MNLLQIHLFLLCFMALTIAHGSNTITDSLERQLEQTQDDTLRIELMLELSQAYYVGEKCLQYAEDALALAKSNGTTDQVGRAYTQVAWTSLSSHDSYKTGIYIDSAISKLKEVDSKVGLIMAYRIQGLHFAAFKQYDLALDVLDHALKLSSEINHLEVQCRLLNNMGIIHMELGEGQLAEENLQESYSLAIQLDNDIFIGRAMHNLGRAALVNNDFSLAMDRLIDAYEFRKGINYWNGVSETMVKMVNVIHDARIENKDWRSLERKLERLGFSSTAALLEQILEVPGAIENSSTHELVLSMKGNYYALNGNYKSAYESVIALQNIKDSVNFSQANLEAIADQKVKYERELANTQNEMNQLRLTQSKRTSWWLAGGSLLAGFAALIFFISRKRETKLNEELKAKNLLIEESSKQREVILEERRQMAEQETIKWKEIDDYKNNLFGNITHEFRTPLTVIKGLTKQIAENKSKNGKEDLYIVQKNTDQLLHLVNQMLELTKLQSKEAKPDYVLGDVVEYISYLIESFQSYALSTHKNLVFHAEPEEFLMDYDQSKMRYLISNLVANALKYTPEFGSIKVMIKGEPHHLNIEVTDNGIGIKEEDLPLIFDRFYQVSSGLEREDQGTGIGLSLVKEIVDLLNGEISVQSEWRQGTSFQIRLPVHKESLKQANLVTLSQDTDVSPTAGVFFTAETSNINGDRPRLLLVEDNSDLRKYLSSLLGDKYHLSLAENGEVGLKSALEKIPDLIISDVMMPQMNGYEMCHKLKKDPKTCHIPILMLTARTDEEDRLTGLRRGADAYLSKPFNEEELFIRLQNLLTLRQSIRDQYKGPGIPQHKDEFMSQLNDIILTHLDDELLDIKKLCVLLNVSRTQLHRKVKALTDMSSGHYLRHVRLHQAHELLQDQNLSISEVAYKVGFKYPNNFTIAYKAEFGHLPSEVK